MPIYFEDPKILIAEFEFPETIPLFETEPHSVKHPTKRAATVEQHPAQCKLIDNVLLRGSIFRVQYTSLGVYADNGGYKIRGCFSPVIRHTPFLPPRAMEASFLLQQAITGNGHRLLRSPLSFMRYECIRRAGCKNFRREINVMFLGEQRNGSWTVTVIAQWRTGSSLCFLSLVELWTPSTILS